MPQHPAIIRPPTEQSDPIVTPETVGEGTSTPWALVTSWGPLVDPGGFIDTASASPVTGVVQFVMAGDTTIYDGPLDNAPRFETLIEDIPGCTGYDPTLDILEVYTEILSADPGTDDYGPAVIVSPAFFGASGDDPLGVRWTRFNAGNYQHSNIAGSGSTGGTSNVGQPTGCRVTFPFSFNASQTALACVPITSYKRSDGSAPASVGAVVNIPGIGFTPGAGGWTLAIGVIHASADTGTPTFQVRLFARLLRRVGVFPDGVI